jgi:2-phosphoglycerate kinase
MPRTWQVLLLGGSGGTGKTRLAEILGRRLAVSFGQLDDFRLVLQRVTSAAHLPALHYFVATENVWHQPAEVLRDRLIDVAAVVSDALRVVAAHHAVTQHPLILEGDGLLPSVVAELISTDRHTQELVRAVFLHEPEETAIYERMLARGRGFDARPRRERDVQVRTNWLYGEWLRAEAERLGLPVLAPHPWETLPDRVLDAIA